MERQCVCLCACQTDRGREGDTKETWNTRVEERQGWWQQKEPAGGKQKQVTTPLKETDSGSVVATRVFKGGCQKTAPSTVWETEGDHRKYSVLSTSDTHKSISSKKEWELQSSWQSFDNAAFVHKHFHPLNLLWVLLGGLSPAWLKGETFETKLEGWLISYQALTKKTRINSLN